MILGIDSLLVNLAFLVPGFIATKLLSARTAATPEEKTTFEELLESLLRSVIINLIAFPVALVLIGFLSFSQTQINSIQLKGISEFFWRNPFLAEQFFFAALMLALFLALATGYFWDPLDVLGRRLLRKTGQSNLDPVTEIVSEVLRLRAKEKKRMQIWIQARHVSGGIYQGELGHIGFPRADNSRELLLSTVSFFPADFQEGAARESIDHVLLNSSSLESIEVKIVKGKD